MTNNKIYSDYEATQFSNATHINDTTGAREKREVASKRKEEREIVKGEAKDRERKGG